MSQSKMGARVQYCGHDGWFVADIFRVGSCNVVRASGPVRTDKLNRPAKVCTHHLVDYPEAGFWRPDLGVFVVPEKQVTELKE